MTTPHNVIRFAGRAHRKHDCQGENVVPLETGMDQDEIRRLNIYWQCQARIRTEANSLRKLRGPIDAAWFLRAVAEEIEGTPNEHRD